MKNNLQPMSAAGWPPAPASLTVQSVSATENKLVWTSENNYSGFSIERKKAGGSYAEVAVAEAQARSYSDPLVLPGTQYTYRVRAFTREYYSDVYDWSDYSNEASIATPGQAASTMQNNNGNPDHSAIKRVINFTLGQKSYQVDGSTRQMESAAVSLEGRTMLPVKSLAESLGAQLGWDAAARRVTFSQADKVIEFTIGESTALVNSQPVPIDAANPAVVPVVSAEGRTLLPLGFISASLGCTVEWNPLTQSITLITR